MGKIEIRTTYTYIFHMDMHTCMFIPVCSSRPNKVIHCYIVIELLCLISKVSLYAELPREMSPFCWMCTFPMNQHVRSLIGWLVCPSVSRSVILSLYLTKGREVTLPCSYRFILLSKIVWSFYYYSSLIFIFFLNTLYWP